MRSWLADPINKQFRKRTVGDIGIELELEGDFSISSDSLYWSWKEEGSLRNGLEFVLRKPVKLEDMSEALSELQGILDKCHPIHSIRCSTHIHINVLRLTHKEVYNAILYYFLLEDLLVSTQGPLREGNLFCLRMSDAEGVTDSIHQSIAQDMGFTNFSMDTHKYGAINLAAVRTFGSLEFRFFRPLPTPVIDKWARIMYNIVHVGASINLKEILSFIDNGEYLKALTPVFTLAEISELFSGDIQRHLEQNFDNVNYLLKALSAPKIFKLPHGLNEDYDDTPFDGYTGVQSSAEPTGTEGWIGAVPLTGENFPWPAPDAHQGAAWQWLQSLEQEDVTE